MRRWRLSWPVIVATTLLGLEQVWTPMCILAGLSRVAIITSSMILGTVTISFWSWFLPWFVSDFKMVKPIQKAVEDFHAEGLLRQAKILQEMALSFWDTFIHWSAMYAKSQIAVSRWPASWIHQVVALLIQNTHVLMTYPVLVGLSLMPIGWIVALIIHARYPVRGGLAVILVFNIVKTYFINSFWIWVSHQVNRYVVGIVACALLAGWLWRRYKSRGGSVVYKKKE